MGKKKKKTINTKQNIKQHKSFKFELTSADDTGEFSGYAAVFGNVDDGMDVIEKGAFTKTIKEDFDRIKILALHNDNWLPVGKPIELREDNKGLFIKGKISDTAMGRDIRTLLKDGVLNEMSIGYDVVRFDFDSEEGIRHLKEIRLWEVSIVTWAMNEQAKIEEVKSIAESLKHDIKAGKITRTKLDTIRPFINVIRELTDMLSPFLEPEVLDENNSQQNNTQTINLNKSQSKKQIKSRIIFEII